jgi:hypothetical protein
VTCSPNSFASTEYAPGPRKKSEADVSIVRMWSTLMVCSAKNRFATAIAQTITARINVRNPIQSDTEVKTMKERTAQ